jgi:hypothetical protein
LQYYISCLTSCTAIQHRGNTGGRATQGDGSSVLFYLTGNTGGRFFCVVLSYRATQGDGSSVLFYLTDQTPLIIPKLTPVNLSICLIDKPFLLSNLITSSLFCFS